MSSLYHFFSRRLFWLASISILVMLISQLFGRFVWQLELFSHYVPHVAVLALLAGIFYPKKVLTDSVVSTLRTKYALPFRILLLLIGLGLALWSVQPISLLFSNKPSSTNPITIHYQNVNISHTNPEQIINSIVDKNMTSMPDIIALVEAGGSNWQASLNELGHFYPTHCGINENSPFAIQVFANNVTAECEIIKILDFPLIKLNLPASTTKIDTSKQSDNLVKNNRILYIAHPPPPIVASMAQSRNYYLNELAKLVNADSENNVMVVGDFNTSAFSPIYRDFIRNSTNEMHESQLNRTTLTGLPTWMPVVGIGIDHILVNSLTNGIPTDAELTATTQALNWNGSDHRGFLIEWHQKGFKPYD